VAGFPQTYQIVRRGVITPVTVRDHETLLSLRTELELVVRFGAGATGPVVAALDAKLARIQSEGIGQTDPPAADIEDMRTILSDGLNPAAAAAIAEMDADFPQARGEINMESIQQESEQFHQDVADEIETSGVPDAEELGRAFTQATGSVSSPSTSEDTPATDEAAIDPVKPAMAERADPAATGDSAADEPDAISGEAASATGADGHDAAATGPDEPEVDSVQAALAEAAGDLDRITGEDSACDDSAAELDHGAAENGSDSPAPVVHAEPPAEPQPSADIGTAGDPLDAASDPSLETATEPLSEDLTTTEDEATAIASALQEVTAELDAMGDSIEASVGTTEDAVGAQEETWVGEPPEMPVAPVDRAGSQPCPTPSQTRPTTSSLREEIVEIKGKLLSALEGVAPLLDRIDQANKQVEAKLARAAAFQRAAEEAQEAGQRVATAQAEAVEARGAYSRAQEQLEQARATWKAAQQTATDAASHAQEDQPVFESSV